MCTFLQHLQEQYIYQDDSQWNTINNYLSPRSLGWRIGMCWFDKTTDDMAHIMVCPNLNIVFCVKSWLYIGDSSSYTRATERAGPFLFAKYMKWSDNDLRLFTYVYIEW